MQQFRVHFRPSETLRPRYWTDRGQCSITVEADRLHEAAEIAAVEIAYNDYERALSDAEIAYYRDNVIFSVKKEVV